MTTTLQALREKLSTDIGDYREGTTTSAGVSGGTTLNDTALADKPDNYYNGFYVRVTSGSYTGVKLITTFVSSGGVVTFASAYGGQIASGVTYELHGFNPDTKDTMLKAALRDVYDDLFKQFRIDYLITGDWLRNGSFEWWTASTVPDNWNRSNVTATEETTIVRHGASSLKHVSTAANSYVEQSQTQLRRLLDLRNQAITVRGWLYTDTASHARIEVVTVDNDGTTTTTSSGYHSGSSRWEILEVEVTLPEKLRSISIRLKGALTATTSYWDGFRLFAGSVYDYYLPPSGWQTILLVDYGGLNHAEADSDPCDDEGTNVDLTPIYNARVIDDGTDRILRIPSVLWEGRKLVLEGLSYLTQPTADTGTTEIDEPQTSLVVGMAATKLYRSLMGTLPADDLGRLKEMADTWDRERLALITRYGMTKRHRANFRG